MADKHIKLIVTGDSEKQSLHKSLKNCFPEHTTNGDLVVWDIPRKADGVTSHRLKAGTNPSNSMITLVNTMFAEVLESKQPNGIRPDLVIVIDDVELGNVGQEDVVVQAFQAAVKAKLDLLRTEKSANHFSSIQARIQTCCSFHLLCPMIESYFFSSAATLKAGGVVESPSLVHATDVEQFDASSDSNQEWQSLCQTENSQKQLKDSWWKTERHPKRYWAHLLSVSAAPVYHETTLGAHMIKATNWSTVAKTSTDSPIISALLEDIWDWFGQIPPTGQFQGASSATTYRVKTTRPNQRMLRNI